MERKTDTTTYTRRVGDFAFDSRRHQVIILAKLLSPYRVVDS